MYDKIVAIISQEGENVPLQEHVMAVVIALALFVFYLCPVGILDVSSNLDLGTQNISSAFTAPKTNCNA